MCFGNTKLENRKVFCVHNGNEEIENEAEPNSNVPQHVDYPLLNTNVKTGILGFRYETKEEMFTIYSSLETKTFCMIMQLAPLRN